MKKIITLLLAFTVLLSLTACKEEETFYTNISNEELIEMLNSDVEYQFIDVRTLEEYNDMKINGFNMLMDVYVLDINTTMLNSLDKDIPVVLMCNSGNRSVDAAQIFQDEGFTTIYNLTDGIQGWIAEGYETE